MTQFDQVVRNFLEQSRGSRSTILFHLTWLIGILFTTFLATLYAKAPFWMSLIFMSAGLIVVSLFLFVYLYYLVKSPQMLRSETYQLTRMAIEKSIIGTSETGLIEAKNLDAPKFPDINSESTKYLDE